MSKVKGREQSFIPIDSIDRGNRLRQRRENIGSLVSSVRRHGVLQPITVIRKSALNQWLSTYSGKITDDRKPFLLIAGNHRIDAAILNELSIIPAYIIEADIPLWKAESMELDENIERYSQSWTEDVEAIASIHKGLQKKKRKPTTPNDPLAHSIKDTASKLNYNVARVRESVELAAAFNVFPELRACTSRHKAYEKLGKLTGRGRKAQALKAQKFAERRIEEVLPITAIEAEDLEVEPAEKQPKKREVEDLRERFKLGLIRDVEEEDIDAVKQRTIERIKERFTIRSLNDIIYPKESFDLLILEDYALAKVSLCQPFLKPNGLLLSFNQRRVLTEHDYLILLKTFTKEGDLVLIPDAFDGEAVFAGLLLGRNVLAHGQKNQGHENFIKKVDSGYPYE